MELDFESWANNRRRAAFGSLGESSLEDADLHELGCLTTSESTQQVLKW